MEDRQISELAADPKNPRLISAHDAKSLANSLQRFGDLSPVVFNVRTGQLVGGHQRLNVMKGLPLEQKVVISERFDQPDEVGTVAVGFIHLGTKRFSYREVDWDEGTQKAANIAANRIQGEFDVDLLEEVTYEISQLENSQDLLSDTGMTVREINNLLKQAGGEAATIETPPTSDDGRISFKLSPDEMQRVREIIRKVKLSTGLDHPSEEVANGMILVYICDSFMFDQNDETPTAPILSLPQVPVSEQV